MNTENHYAYAIEFMIPRRLDGMNEIIASSKREIKFLRRRKKRVYEITQRKAELEAFIGVQIRRQLPRDLHIAKLFVDFIWLEHDARRDPDNIAAGKKFILDALVKSGIISNDGHATIVGFSDTFFTGCKRPGVRVVLKVIL